MDNKMMDINKSEDKMPENWDEIVKDYVKSKKTASEAISDAWRISKAKDFAIACLTAGIVAIGIGMAIINYKNDCHWRDLFSSYDYVSQDGNGYNYYNSDVGGNVNNGADNQEEE